MTEMPRGMEQPPKTRGLTAIAGAIGLIAVLLIVQIWLLSASLELFLAGKRSSAFPAALFSGVLFLICFGLYLFIHRVDREVRSRQER